MSYNKAVNIHIRNVYMVKFTINEGLVTNALDLFYGEGGYKTGGGGGGGEGM